MSLVRILFFSALAILGVIFGVYSGISSFRQIEYRRVEINRATVIAEVAADIETRRLGLVDKKSIAPNYGMLFMFAKPDYHGLWMKGMKFPVDVIWIKNSRVVDLEENILPSVVTQADNVLPVYKPDALASMALEVKAGFVRRNSVKIGDEIKISGHDREFNQKIESMQIEHEKIEKAAKGKVIGMKVSEPVKENDLIFKVN